MARKRRSTRKSTKQRTQQKRFKAAAKKCRGKNLKSFRACMRKALKKRR